MGPNKSELTPKRKNQTWRALALALGLAVGLGAAETKTLVFFGDSLTAGYGVDPDEAYPALVQKKLDEAGRPWRVVNAGLSGETSAGGLRRLDWILRQPVHCFVIELGGNDGLRGIAPATTRANLETMIQRVRQRYPDATVVLAGMQMPTNMGPEYTAQFAAIYPDAARTGGAVLIPFLLEGVGGVPSLNLPDGIHPTPEGHRIVAETVWRTLHPLL
ncbi:Esterase TesA precursor [Lacunisphaera limnophila]|uniref:Esterase TesA n=1 Tax=Lacunisphaera limnophila TaxID=1838286 RepID=A0A1D8AVV5_9BACT|nr:arylesterase [Lacunisphaera limnophila]AOS45027.1 Esterase TesA precursor [Lacunisphaera limnophila]